LRKLFFWYRSTLLAVKWLLQLHELLLPLPPPRKWKKRALARSGLPNGQFLSHENLTNHARIYTVSTRVSFPGFPVFVFQEFPGIIFYLINSQLFHFLKRFSLHCLNFKHYCFKCNANPLLGDFFNSHNNLALKFYISDFLEFCIFFDLLCKTFPGSSRGMTI
jgi:hypothetical protein